MMETKDQRIARKWGVAVTQRTPTRGHPRRYSPGSQRNLVSDAIRRRLASQFGVNCTNCFQSVLRDIARLSVAQIAADSEELAKSIYENAKERSRTNERGAAALLDWADYKTHGLTRFKELIDDACRPYMPTATGAAAPSPPGTRHFLYHIGAFSHSDIWRLNVAHVLKRMWLFNGIRTVAIVTGPGLVDPEEVKAAFQNQITKFIVIPNSERLREVATFVPLLSEVQGYPSDITFYGHAKGVTRPVNEGVTVHPWTEILYETCLDYFPLVARLLEKHPMAGSFKKVGHGFRGSRSTWHYSGTFYWFRNRDVFARAWDHIDQVWWGTESWPGIMFSPDDAGCVFHAGTVPRLNLYSMDYLTRTVLPELALWRESHRNYRLVQEVSK